jgi:hypothetical protein
MNDTTNDTKSGKSATAAEKKTSPLLLVGIGAGALVAGLLAYLVTTKLVDGGASPCEAAKAEILEIKALAPDAAMLDTRPDLSLRLSNAGRELQSTCIYIDGREFEMANVEPWLGTPPAAGATAPTTPAPAEGIAPATTLAPTPSTVPSIAPETTTAGG